MATFTADYADSPETVPFSCCPTGLHPEGTKYVYHLVTMILIVGTAFYIFAANAFLSHNKALAHRV